MKSGGGGGGSRTERTYRRLLLLLPAELRSEFGDEMVALFRARLNEAGGPGRRLWVWIGGVLDVTWQAVVEAWAGHRTRQMEGTGLMGGTLKDVRFGLRMLAHYPVFSALSALTLATGIGAVTLLFTLVNGVLLKGLPYPDAGRLVMLSELSEKGSAMVVSYPNLVDWRERSRSFEGLTAGYYLSRPTIRGVGDPFEARAMGVAKGFFRTIGVQPWLGRAFTDQENDRGGPPVVVVSHAFWQTYLGAAARLDDVTFQMGSGTMVVVGVMPADFQFLTDADIWFPLEQSPIDIRAAGNHWVLGRLAPGVTAAQARQEMNSIAANLKREYGNDELAVGVEIRPLRNVVVGDAGRPLGVLLGAAALVLLLACSNVAGMLLARGKLRETEFGMRVALGAGRGRLVAQLVAEGSVLAMFAAGGGLLLSLAGLHFVKLSGAGMVPRLGEVSIDGSVLLFAVACAVLTVLIATLPPSLSVSHGVERAIRGGARAGRAKSLFWRMLVGLEVALALMLVVGAGLLVRSLSAIYNADTGYDSHGVVTVEFVIPGDQYPDAPTRLGFIERARAELAALPGVQSTGVGGVLPMNPTRKRGPVRIPPNLDIRDPAAWAAVAGWRVVDNGYFEALGIPLTRGRLFGPGDVDGAPNVTIVNASLAATLWPDQDPLGRTLRANWDFRDEDFTVVGVVGEARRWDRQPGRQPELYVPYQQRPEHADWMYIVLRARGDPGALINPVRQAFKQLDPRIYADVGTLDADIVESTADRRFTTAVLGGLAGVSLILAFAGIFGVVSQTVASREREIGVRLALGGTPSQVVRLLGTQALVWVGLGDLAGILGAVAGTRLLDNMLFGIGHYDMLSFTIALGVVLLAALLASLVPAIRMARLDPVTTLRAE